MNKNVKTLPSGVRFARGTNSSKKKGKQQAQIVATIHLTPQNIPFRGLNGLECRKWWQDTPNDHAVKNNIRKAQVEWAIRMPVFCIREYEGFLETMIDAYNRFSKTSSFSYLEWDLVISFRAADFTRVFGIPKRA